MERVLSSVLGAHAVKIGLTVNACAVKFDADVFRTDGRRVDGMVTFRRGSVETGIRVMWYIGKSMQTVDITESQFLSMGRDDVLVLLASIYVIESRHAGLTRIVAKNRQSVKDAMVAGRSDINRLLGGSNA